MLFIVDAALCLSEVAIVCILYNACIILRYYDILEISTKLECGGTKLV
jgi:hypothetical protein